VAGLWRAAGLPRGPFLCRGAAAAAAAARPGISGGAPAVLLPHHVISGLAAH